jgi:FkbM family methyltransferase
MLSTAKRSVQNLLDKFGYRLVPRNRDAMSLKKYLDRLPLRAVIDVGANNGSTCTEWLRTYPEAQIHAIEALDRYQGPLQSIAARSNGRMRVWQYAASDEAGEVTFLEHVDHPSSSSLLQSTDESHALLPFTKSVRSVQVKAIPIDSLFAEQGIDLPDGIFLKMDVQGAEAKVLRGAQKTLAKVSAVLAEVNLLNLYDGQAGFADLISVLDGHGLKLAGMLEQFHDENNRPVYFDAVFLREV